MTLFQLVYLGGFGLLITDILYIVNNPRLLNRIISAFDLNVTFKQFILYSLITAALWPVIALWFCLREILKILKGNKYGSNS